jgi:hypothetical protein
MLDWDCDEKLPCVSPRPQPSCPTVQTVMAAIDPAVLIRVEVTHAQSLNFCGMIAIEKCWSVGASGCYCSLWRVEPQPQMECVDRFSFGIGVRIHVVRCWCLHAYPRREDECFDAETVNELSFPFARPLVLEPPPLVTRSHKRTVANADSNTLVVRKCFQCSAGNSKKRTRRSHFAVSDSTALG